MLYISILYLYPISLSSPISFLYLSPLLSLSSPISILHLSPLLSLSSVSSSNLQGVFRPSLFPRTFLPFLLSKSTQNGLQNSGGNRTTNFNPPPGEKGLETKRERKPGWGSPIRLEISIPYTNAPEGSLVKGGPRAALGKEAGGAQPWNMCVHV